MLLVLHSTCGPHSDLFYNDLRKGNDFHKLPSTEKSNSSVIFKTIQVAPFRFRGFLWLTARQCQHTVIAHDQPIEI